MEEEKYNKYNWMMADCPFKSHALRFGWQIYKIIMWSFFALWVRLKLKKIFGLHEELAKNKRVDISPTSGGGRGFIIVLDQKTSFYFYQDGDHFIYDGCEMGEYEKGDVTVFDGK